MLTVCKKEFRGYFTSMTGYVFIAFMLVISGIYFTAYHLQAGYPIYGYSLSSITFVFLIVTPILTMRSLAEEQKQKTDQLLLTSPLSVQAIVGGKFLGLAGVFAVPVLLMCTYPLILSSFGTVNLKMAYASLLAFFLLGCANLAIGLFISSLTESQIIAAVLTFIVLFLCYMMNGIETLFSETASSSLMAFVFLVLALCVLIYYVMKNTFLAILTGIVGEAVLFILYSVKSSLFEGAIQKLLDLLNLTGHFDDFVDGIFSVSGIVYYLSVIGIFLFLTVQSIQKRRWS
ncbi:MAG: ABC transporter permease subunit [Eubacteriales bacterium]|nr:ABC transporter permease subunit [Eubacteriales bacterium]